MLYRISLLLFGILAFSAPVSAATLVDPNYTAEELKTKACLDPDLPKIFTTKTGRGILTSYSSPDDLVMLLTGLYGCEAYAKEITHAPDTPEGDGIVYLSLLPFGKTSDGRVKTLFDTYKSSRGRLNLSEGTVLYSTLEDIMRSEGFKRKLAEKGVGGVYIQALDIFNLENGGLYNSRGEMIVDKQNHRVEPR